MLVEDLVRAAVVEAGEPHAARHFADHLPVGARFAGRGQEGALARDAAFGVGHRAVFLAPAERGQHVRAGIGVGALDDVGGHHQFAALQRAPRPVGVGQADQRIGGHHPHRLDAAGLDGIEQLHRLQPRTLGGAGACQKARTSSRWPASPSSVGGQHIGRAAYLAPAHGVGLAGQRERPGARFADAPGQQVAVDQAVDLVGAGRGLVHALREGCDHLGRLGEPAVEGQQVLFVEAAGACHLGGIGAARARAASAVSSPAVWASTKAASAAPWSTSQASRPLNRRTSVPGFSAGAGRPARRWRCGADRSPRCADPDGPPWRVPGAGRGWDGTRRRWSRPAPPVGQFGLHSCPARVFAEGALVAGHRRGHAQTGIGVDVGAADAALHQLVGDVVVLGQQLSGDVEGDRVRPWRAITSAKPRATASSASSQPARRRPPSGVRSCGASRRPSVPSVSPSAEPLTHSRPGWRVGRIAADLDASVGLQGWHARRSRRRNRGGWRPPRRRRRRQPGRWRWPRRGCRRDSRCLSTCLPVRLPDGACRRLPHGYAASASHWARPAQQPLSHRADAGAALDQVEIPGAVLHVAVQHGTHRATVLQYQPLVHAAPGSRSTVFSLASPPRKSPAEYRSTPVTLSLVAVACWM